MNISLPFLTAYDPSGTSEGPLDPLGLYQIADQLAVQLVPAIRERMQRVRFLTAMSVGALLTADLEEPPRQRDASPFLVWEWFVVEALVRRAKSNDDSLWGVPGTLVTRRALDNFGYLDARSYLKTARIFGFHGVYKRLAVHVGLVDTALRPANEAEPLADAWARDAGFGGLRGARSIFQRWKAAIHRSLCETPPRTNLAQKQAWTELAEAFDPSTPKSRERKTLLALLFSDDDRKLGALSRIWQLQGEFADDEYQEEQLHNRLEAVDPSYGALLTAIRSYETFARSLQDAFDILKAAAATADGSGYRVSMIAEDQDFRHSIDGLNQRYAQAEHALGDVQGLGLQLQGLFSERFQGFAGPLTAKDCARELCAHHERVQDQKSAEGKRAWYDWMGPDRIHIRSAYREPRREIQPGRYVHDYRGWPIRRFYQDLT